jgi:hypothetical protein
MSLYSKLIDAGLPIESATEEGAISGLPGVVMTPEQVQKMNDIVLEHFRPAEWADLSSHRADVQQIRDEYTATINQLQNIENATNPTNAQVIAAVKFLAKTLRLLLKLLARQYRNS